MIKVSVLMLTFKHENYLSKAIEGVLMQKCSFEFELVIADDCSPDNTKQIVDKYLSSDPRAYVIKYNRHNENKGAHMNFRWALEQCSGEYIALCEGDDYWTSPLKLQKQFDFLNQNEDYVMCFHKVDILMQNGLIVPDFLTTVPSGYQNREVLLMSSNYIHTCSVMFRNKKIKIPAEFDFSLEGDYLLYVLLTKYGKIGFIEESMAIYRYNVGILGHVKNNYFKNKMIVNLISLKLSNNSIEDKILIDKNIDFVVKYYAHNIPFKILISNIKQLPRRFYSKFISRIIFSQK